MKNSITALVLIVLALACVFGIVSLEASIPATADTNTPAPEPVATEVYTVRAHGEGIGVFFGDSAEPMLFYSTDLSIYPEADVRALREGITVTSYGELRSLIEDYIG